MTSAARSEAASAAPSPIPSDHCSIVGALDALGDSWSILVLRELFFGVRRFNDIQEDLGVSRSVLTNRLARLVEQGIVRTRPYQEPGERERNEYHLTRKGVALLPVMVSLLQWGDEYINEGEGPTELLDRIDGSRVRVELRSDRDVPVAPVEIVPVLRSGKRRRR